VTCVGSACALQSSATKTWYNSDGLSTSVETPQIARARHLQEMYNVLLNDLFDQDERIDILMTVKNTVKVFLLPSALPESSLRHWV